MYENYFNRKKIESFVEQCVVQNVPHFYLSKIVLMHGIPADVVVKELEVLVSEQVLTKGYQDLSKSNEIHPIVDALQMYHAFSEENVVVVYSLTNEFKQTYLSRENLDAK